MRKPTRKSRTRAAAAAAAAALLTAAVAACGSPGGSSTGGSGGGSSHTLTIITGFGTTIQADFNPYQMATQTATGGTNLLYLPLAAYNPLNGSYIPYLATAVKIVSPTQVDFTLRSGVTWSDGTPVTVADVEYSFNLLKKNPALDTTGVSAQLQSVTASGNTITFTLKAPNSQIAPNLAQVPIVPASAWAGVANPVTFANANPTVTDGPYELQTVSSVKVVLKKNPKYFASAQMSQAPDTVTGLPQVPGATQVLDMEKGVFDLNQTNDSDRGGFATDYVGKDPAHNKYWLPPLGTLALLLNQAKAPFNDLKFRQALNYGINRATASKQANVNGYEPPASQTGLTPTDYNLIPASVPNNGVITYDPAKARQILLSDGYHYSGSTLIGKDGKPVTFALQTVQGFVDWLGSAQAIAASLSQLGITVQVTQVQQAAAFANMFSGQYDTALDFSSIQGYPYANYQALLASYLTAPVGHMAVGNYERLNDPTVDGLLGQVSATTSTAAQHAALGSLAAYVYNSVPVIELTVYPGWYEYTTKNYTGWPDASNQFADPDSLWGALEMIPQLKAAQ
jgi:peptide/nickel transport system substrate-binding protein